MNDYEFLETVKAMMGITGSYQDQTLLAYIDEVINYCIDAGVSEKTAKSQKCVGTITRGVIDLWNYGSGGAAFSPYFHNRVIQLAYADGNSGSSGGGDEDETEVIPITKSEIDMILDDE